MEQGSKEWFDARRCRITGSNVGAVLGLCPYTTKEHVLRRMVRDAKFLPSEFEDNHVTGFGKANEDNAIMEFELAHGVTTQKCGFFPYQEWLGASPDRIGYELDLENNSKKFCVEVKCPYSLKDNGQFLSLSELPHYYAQIQIEMLCSESDYCYFVQWSPQLGIVIEKVWPDEGWLYQALHELDAFFALFLTEIDNPEHSQPLVPDISDPETEILRDEFLELSTSIELAEERKKEILTELQEHSSGASALIGEGKLSRVVNKKTNKVHWRLR